MKSLLLSLSLILALWNTTLAQQPLDTLLVLNELESTLMMARLDRLCAVLKAAGYTDGQLTNAVVFPKAEKGYLSGDTLWSVAAQPRTPNASLDPVSIEAHAGAMYFSLNRQGKSYPVHQVMVEWTQAPGRYPLVLMAVQRLSSPYDRWTTVMKTEKEFADELYRVVGRLELAISKPLK